MSTQLPIAKHHLRLRQGLLQAGMHVDGQPRQRSPPAGTDPCRDGFAMLPAGLMLIVDVAWLVRHNLATASTTAGFTCLACTTMTGSRCTTEASRQTHPGMYYVGLPFQYTLTSTLIGGVGRNADQRGAAPCQTRTPCPHRAVTAVYGSCPTTTDYISSIRPSRSRCPALQPGPERSTLARTCGEIVADSSLWGRSVGMPSW